MKSILTILLAAAICYSLFILWPGPPQELKAHDGLQADELLVADTAEPSQP